MVVFHLVDMVHKASHRFPTLIHDSLVAKLLPDGPRYDDTSICPSQSHHLVAILGRRGHTRVSSRFALRISHVAHPFMEEAIGIGKERTSLCKHLSISHPAQTLITLRTIRGHREIIGTLTPAGVRNQLVNKFVSCGDGAYFEVLGYRSNRYRYDFLEFYVIASCY